MLFRVKWETEVTADSPEAAAAQAVAIQRDPKSSASFDIEIMSLDGKPAPQDRGDFRVTVPGIFPSRFVWQEGDVTVTPGPLSRLLDALPHERALAALEREARKPAGGKPAGASKGKRLI